MIVSDKIVTNRITVESTDPSSLLSFGSRRKRNHSHMSDAIRSWNDILTKSTETIDGLPFL